MSPVAEPWRLQLDLLQPGLGEILASLISVPTSTYVGFCPIRGDNITGQVGEVKEERCLSDWKSGLNQPPRTCGRHSAARPRRGAGPWSYHNKHVAPAAALVTMKILLVA